MILRTLADTLGTNREVDAATWTSRRLLLKDDRMGFSMHDTLIKAGTQTPMWYRNHLEAVYCIAGDGEIETLDDGKCYPVGPGTIYALDKNDRHVLRARTELRMICVFNPPLTGMETHDADGAYPSEAVMLAQAS